MEFRAATPGDAETIREVARESLDASYSPALDEETIEAAVDSWYTRENVEEAVEDRAAAILLVVEGETILGFAKGVVVERREPVGEIHWLHVAPDHRGRGVGARLLDHIEDELAASGANRLAGFVLEVNEAGAEFYERHGYDRAGSRDIAVGDETFAEVQYERRIDADGPGASPLQPVTVGGGTRYIAYDEGERGSKGSFYPLYDDRERETRYGVLCGSCETDDVAVNSMGAYECSTCANRHKASRWDAAYL